MNISKESNNSGGFPVGTVLTIVFIVLKLCHVIDWSWIWVLSPTWICLLIFLVCMAIIKVIERIDRR